MLAFRVLALDPAPFRPLYGLDDAVLEAMGASPTIVRRTPGYPCRVSLRDAEPGERVILMNYEHLDSRHAIFVRDGAERAEPGVDELPPYLERRLLSVRAFDASKRMLAADVVEGRSARALFALLLGTPETSFLHVHNAREGCYLARVERA